MDGISNNRRWRGEAWVCPDMLYSLSSFFVSSFLWGKWRETTGCRGYPILRQPCRHTQHTHTPRQGFHQPREAFTRPKDWSLGQNECPYQNCPKWMVPNIATKGWPIFWLPGWEQNRTFALFLLGIWVLSIANWASHSSGVPQAALNFSVAPMPSTSNWGRELLPSILVPAITLYSIYYILYIIYYIYYVYKSLGLCTYIIYRIQPQPYSPLRMISWRYRHGSSTRTKPFKAPTLLLQDLSYMSFDESLANTRCIEADALPLNSARGTGIMLNKQGVYAVDG